MTAKEANDVRIRRAIYRAGYIETSQEYRSIHLEALQTLLRINERGGIPDSEIGVILDSIILAQNTMI